MTQLPHPPDSVPLQDTPANSERENARELHERLCEAMCQADTDTITELLSPDATLTHMTGYIQSKAEWLGEIEAGTMRHFSVTTVATSRRGNEFIFTTLCDADIWGMRNTWHLGLCYTLQPDGATIARIQAFSW